MSSKQNTRDEKIAQISQNLDESKVGTKRTNIEAKQFRLGEGVGKHN